MVEPLGVGHGGARGDHADPGAVGGLGEEDGDAQAAGEDGEAGDVVLMLVGDEDGVEGGGVFAGEGHALEEFAAGEAGVDEQAGAGGGDDRGVALGAGGEDGHAHIGYDTPLVVGCRRWGSIRSGAMSARGWTASQHEASGARLEAEDVGSVLVEDEEDCARRSLLVQATTGRCRLEGGVGTVRAHECYCGRFERGEEVDGAAQDDLVALVVGEGAGADDAVVFARVGVADADDLDLGADGVAGADGHGPAHLFDACADHAAGDGDGLDAEAHDDGCGEPAGGGEAFEEGAFAGGLVEVEGLRVVLLAELLDLFGGDLGAAEGVNLLAYVEVFEVKLLRHGFSCVADSSVSVWTEFRQ